MRNLKEVLLRPGESTTMKQMSERIIFIGKNGDLSKYILAALRDLGHTCLFIDQRGGISYRFALLRKGVHRIAALKKLREWEIKRLNSAILKEASSFKPTLVLVWNGDTIATETIQSLRSQGITTANWFLDLMTHWEIIKKVAPVYDYFFTPDAEVISSLQKIGVKSHKASFAFKAAFERFPEGARQYPVSFVGSYDPKIWRKREELLRALTDFNVHIWGPPIWKATPLANNYHGGAAGEKMIEIYRKSKIVVDIPWDHIPASAISIRPYEVTASGACLFFYDIRPEMSELFNPDKEYVSFKNAQELREKVRYYLDHPHELHAVAYAGYQRFMRDHTYHKRLADMLSIIRS